MKRGSIRLGLDIGTNSIGWCLYDGDTIRDIGVRIFSDGRDPKSGASLAVDRRDARAMRRRRDRYLGRRSALVEQLVVRGLLPKEKEAATDLHGEDPYTLRVRALDEKLEPHQIGRALFHLNQRRGFKSNRKADRVSNANEDGKIASGTKALDQAMMDAGARTLGEFLHGRETKRVRMRPEADGYDFYPDRKHYEQEFEAIWSAQAPYYPALLSKEEKAAIHRIIFFQRPLKAQVVGKCSFAGWYGIPDDERRLPKAHPLFQQRRLYEEVNQLEVVSAGAPSRKLTLDERDKLILKLQDKKKVTFKALGKLIKLKEAERFNKESENRKELIGDEIRAELMDKKRFGPRWTTFSADQQWKIIDRLMNEESTERLLAWLKENYGLDQEVAESVANAHLPEGYGRFGITATTALLDQLRANVVTYSQAAEGAGYHHSDFRDGQEHRELPYYGEVLAREIAPGKEDYTDKLERQWGKITNPTVHIGLNQLRKLVNAIVRKYGRPDYIYVELARELKLNEKQKAEHNRRIKQTTDAAAARSEKLKEIGQRDNGGNRMLLRIWEQLNPANPLDRRCPYCGEMISLEMLMNGSADVDHIIPYSRCLDDSVGNKVVSHTHCNRQKGNRTPWEQWGQTERWPIVQDQVARLHKSKQWRFGPDAMERVDRDGGFIARQLTDTQYLSRLAGKYLSSLYTPDEGRRVYAITGRMTAMLRRLWGLNDILPDHNWVENEHSNAPKNRLDHRHHAIDAAVVGITDAAMIQKIATAAGRAEERDLDRQFLDLERPWDGFREDLREKLFATTVSFKPDHGRKGKPEKDHDVTSGRLHNDTAYGLTGRTNAKGVPIVVTRKPLLSLKPKDLIDPERMPDSHLQEALYEATRGTSGKAFENALRQFAKQDGPFKGIRRVRLTEPLNVIPIRDKEGRAYKAVKGDANARFDVWRLPDGKWVTKWKDRDGQEQSSIISMFDAHQRNFKPAKPHPAAKKVLSLRQNDLLAVERDGDKPEIMRVIKFGGNGQIFLAEDNEAGALKNRDADSQDPFKYTSAMAGSLKKMKARQIRIDELGHIHDPGPRD
ncbi:type II CRISPR RNA-guided endonuclease Cas9 [Altererythrobacter indicus]|uniref:CRISPR-associated endonuclease Cas9 n=1 Tax=Altericroceibacterium indicum TaxID=374177 RepID=A0A845A5J0_9SPHN|nr:type II CRISPR RNA-guided endonuclease Cas9 [Altericroceibacterium indicum]MXP25450.1 type II CRISPR RNA-guided endonuclease Cas9 [Altericroceibacterium indicum]